MMHDSDTMNRFCTGAAFVAALDQSGGSTPRALRQYGVADTEYTNDTEMFDLIHEERTRIMTSPVFTGDRILAAILFQGTLDRGVADREVPDYLWKDKGILSILKIDKGLADEHDGVQLMKDIPDLANTLADAHGKGVFGTKQRSVIHGADPAGIRAVVDQQFDLGRRVLDAGLVPILEPEIDIHAPDKEAAETLLKDAVLTHLESMGERRIALKLSIPEVDGFYTDLIEHPRVARVVALSGGFTRAEADERLARNPGLIASFSRALLEGLHRSQSEEDFTRTLDTSIEEIYRASIS